MYNSNLYKCTGVKPILIKNANIKPKENKIFQYIFKPNNEKHTVLLFKKFKTVHSEVPKTFIKLDNKNINKVVLKNEAQYWKNKILFKGFLSSVFLILLITKKKKTIKAHNSTINIKENNVFAINIKGNIIFIFKIEKKKSEETSSLCIAYVLVNIKAKVITNKKKIL